jgi:hypothetical protein
MLHVSLGNVLALLGRRTEALQEGTHAAQLAPIEKDPATGQRVLRMLLQIQIQLGDQEEAIDILRRLLSGPYRLTPGWLRIDPHYDPLRGNPRFQKLLSEPA